MNLIEATVLKYILSSHFFPQLINKLQFLIINAEMNVYAQIKETGLNKEQSHLQIQMYTSSPPNALNFISQDPQPAWLEVNNYGNCGQNIWKTRVLVWINKPTLILVPFKWQSKPE